MIIMLNGTLMKIKKIFKKWMRRRMRTEMRISVMKKRLERSNRIQCCPGERQKKYLACSL